MNFAVSQYQPDELQSFLIPICGCRTELQCLIWQDKLKLSSSFLELSFLPLTFSSQATNDPERTEESMVARRNSTSFACSSIHISIFWAKWLDHYKAISGSDGNKQLLVHPESLATGKHTTHKPFPPSQGVCSWLAHTLVRCENGDSSSKMNSSTYRQTFVGGFQTLTRIPENTNNNLGMKPCGTLNILAGTVEEN